MFGKRMFPGGIHPHEGVGGKAANCGNAIVELSAPPRVIIPLSQHIGAPAKALVQKGDYVKMGQMIGEAGGFVSAPVHSSVSGTVVGVEKCLLANGMEVSAVVIDNDYKDEWTELHPSDHPETLTPKELAGGITFEEAELTFVCRKLYQGQFQREGLADEIRHGIYENWDPHWMFVGEILEVEDKR